MKKLSLILAGLLAFGILSIVKADEMKPAGSAAPAMSETKKPMKKKKAMKKAAKKNMAPATTPAATTPTTPK